MNVKYMISLIAVIALVLLGFAGGQTPALQVFFAVVIPYAAAITFVVGFILKILNWARSPAPFRIPTTCGQQKSLPWIKPAVLENPFTNLAVIGRMFFEVVLFRSLFRNTTNRLTAEGRHVFIWEKWLWLFALAFHHAFLVVVIRHLRFFTEPVPFFVTMLEKLDGFFQMLLPGLFISGFALLVAVTFLFLRRIYLPHVRYISLASDYFPLFLIMGITLSGLLMRYLVKADVVAIKEFTMGLVTFRPMVPEGVGGLFYVHLFLVSALLAYFPFSKLMHLGGVFMSPTRNLPGNSRAVRHVNPWNYPVKVHSYEEYEDDFREKMIDAGLPVEKKE